MNIQWNLFTVLSLMIHHWTSLALAADISDVISAKRLTEFSNLLSKTKEAQPFLNGEVTIFAPSNSAMINYMGKKDSQFVLNHIVNVIVNVETVNKFSSVTRLASVASGSPPLYITKYRGKYYVNGAEINVQGFKAMSDKGKSQKLYLIDQVIEPLTLRQYRSGSSLMVDMTAGKMLREAANLDSGPFTINQFVSRVAALKSFENFDQPGINTYFIPVDSAFEKMSPFLLDFEIIQGHIVLNELLFSNPIINKEHKTATFQTPQNLHVTVKLQKSGKEVQVKSVTTRGNIENPRGEYVVANIVRANIPVSNGIVHLIDRPLVVVASTLWDYIQGERNGTRLGKFARYLARQGGDLQQMIQNCQSGTIFAPSDEAFQPFVEDILIESKEKAEQVLGLHFIDKRIVENDIRIQVPQNGLDMYNTNLPFPKGTSKKLWIYLDSNQTMFVSGIGTTAQVIDGNIGALNGVIHVIDTVLGIPSQTMSSLIKKDPMLRSTYDIGQQDKFMNELSKTGQKFTFLAPANEAWDYLRDNYISVHKQLFMGSFAYQSRNLLERHLLVGESLSLEDLVARGQVQMLRGIAPIKFVQESDGTAIVEWEDNQAKIIRSNLNCTNGYIHVLDTILMKRRDITLSKSTCFHPNIYFSMFLFLLPYLGQ